MGKLINAIFGKKKNAEKKPKWAKNLEEKCVQQKIINVCPFCEEEYTFYENPFFLRTELTEDIGTILNLLVCGHCGHTLFFIKKILEE